MKKLGIFFVIIGFVMASFGAAQPVVAANTGVTGQVVDGKTAQGWGYGAEIMVIQTTGTDTGLKGTAILDANGNFTVSYGSTDTLSLCSSMGGCTTADNFASMQVLISFTCEFDPTFSRPNETTSNDSNCPINAAPGGSPALPPLVGLPGNFEIGYTDNFQSVIRNLGDIDTNRGPTAITLEAISAESTTGISPIMIAAFSLILVGLGLIVVYRQRRNAI